MLDELQNTLLSENSIKQLASMQNTYSIQIKDESQTVKDELKRLEERKLTVEDCIQEIREKGNAAAVSEGTIIGLINKSKDFATARNISECRKFIGSYVESVVAYHDKVEIKFKISVPDKDNNALCPLKVERGLMEVKEKYKKIPSSFVAAVQIRCIALLCNIL